ncbi:MAG: ABC transporter ATP-binding protein [Hyphomicrobiaceae bacterium]|nr:ABC transporter ATP-binding protein [Hyphomicrobiaceae bacterium]
MRLEVRDLAFGYPERPVGRDVSLTVEPGEVLCLLGPNGCGKTTLFKTMLGLLRSQGGAVLLDGAPLSRFPRSEIARRIAYVPQAQASPFPYTALDLVLMGRVAHRGVFAGPTLEDREIAAAALDELGIGNLAHRDVTRLSGGQRQLVMVARAVAQAAPFLIMDEPTASLDFGNQVVVLMEVKRLAARGAGVVLSTHQPDQAFAVADRVCLMRDGQTVAIGLPVETLTSERLEDVYGVAVSIERMRSGQTVCAPRYV